MFELSSLKTVEVAFLEESANKQQIAPTRIAQACPILSGLRN